MHRLFRRNLLQNVGASVLVALTGCISVFDESPETVQFCEGRVVNEDTSSHNVRLQLVEGGRRIYEDARELTGASPTVSNPEIDQRLDSLSVDATDLSSYEGQFTFRVQIDSGGWQDLELTTAASNQVAVLAVITERGSVSFYTSGDDNLDCDHFPEGAASEP